MQEHHQDEPLGLGLPDQNPQTVLVESDRTPRAEKPTIVATQPTPVGTEDSTDEDFFTFKPAEAFASAATSNVQASPTPSIVSSGSSSRLRDAVLDVTRKLSTQFDLGSSSRPSVQRDLSHASATSIESTDSSATVVAATPHPGRLPALNSPTFYPNQAFSALHHQQYPPVHMPPPPGLRPGLFSPFAPAGGLPGPIRLPGINTRDHSPAVTPGLYTPSPKRSTSGTPILESGYSSPYLHHLHTQVPKETHIADIDVDPKTGKKFINDYEIMDELGRGTHGKVKLGRSTKTGAFVAIKIVERFPKKRRLGRMGVNAEDKVKREVAILKKARHPHIVALLEVIDDPTRRKVYIVLERVDLGEIPWRTPGTREISIVEYRRYERESRGIFYDERAMLEDQAIIDLGRIARAKDARKRTRALRNNEHESAWSLELAGDFDDDSEADSASRMSSSAGGMGSPELDRLIQRSKETVSRVESSDLLATVVPARSAEPDTTANMHESDVSGLADALSGTMYGPFEDIAPPPEDESRPVAHNNDTAPLEPVITEDDVNADIQGLTKNLSHGDLAARAAEILGCDMHPDLMYVPCMTIQAARDSFRDTVLGLQYLHYQGIIHRDIKPPNLLQTKDYRTKISDFGVSYLGRPMDDGETDDVSDAEPDVDEAKELAKNVGTAAFYAPELCFNDDSFEHPPIGKAIDIWALGITLFCMIFARVPFVDTEYVVMRRIADEEVYIPSKRLRPVDNKPQPLNASDNRQFGHANYLRGPNALEYEELDDTLLDLLKRLLTKDVKKRATLEEVRYHPWVLEGLEDKLGWLDISAPANTAGGQKIEISREDLETSVVPINLLDKIKSGLKKAAGSVAGLGRSSSTRKRNTSQDGSVASASSSSSAINIDGRRPSLRGDEPIIHALKASRDTEHPLSQSLTASPVNSPPPFPHANTTSLGTPRMGTGSQMYGFVRPNKKEDEQLDKSMSTLSTTGSTRTIRPFDKSSEWSYFDPSLPVSPANPPTSEGSNAAHLNGLISGATRLLKTVRDRSATGRSSTLSSRSSDTGDAHADASVAISTASAEGSVQPPRVLKDPTPASSRTASPRGLRQPSAITTPDFGSRQDGFDVFKSSKDSPVTTSVVRNPVFFSDHKPPTPQTRPVSRLHNDSGGVDFEAAEDELLRRQIAEDLRKRSISPANSDRQHNLPYSLSPDDKIDNESEYRPFDLSADNSIPCSVVPSLATGPASPSSSVVPLMTPVSSEDRFRTELESDTSNTSIPSGAPDHRDDVLGSPLNKLPDSDTIGALQGIDIPPRTARRIASDEDEGYHPDTAVDSDDDSDSSDDGGLLMMHRRPDPRLLTRSISASNSHLARRRSRRDTGDSRISKRSSRRGSSRSTRQTGQARAGSENDGGNGRRVSESLYDEHMPSHA